MFSFFIIICDFADTTPIVYYCSILLCDIAILIKVALYSADKIFYLHAAFEANKKRHIKTLIMCCKV